MTVTKPSSAEASGESTAPLPSPSPGDHLLPGSRLPTCPPGTPWAGAWQTHSPPHPAAALGSHGRLEASLSPSPFLGTLIVLTMTTLERRTQAPPPLCTPLTFPGFLPGGHPAPSHHGAHAAPPGPPPACVRPSTSQPWLRPPAAAGHVYKLQTGPRPGHLCTSCRWPELQVAPLQQTEHQRPHPHVSWAAPAFPSPYSAQL